MSDDGYIERAARMTVLITSQRRITVRRLRDELGLSRSAAYRMLRRLTPVLALRIRCGVVTCSIDGEE